MKINIDDVEREVLIVRKKNNKNTYLRVKDDLSIYVTTNYWTKDKDIIKFITANQNYIRKMTSKKLKQIEYNKNFLYLGKKYDIVILNSKDILLGEDKIFVSNSKDLDKWLRNRAKIVFQEELDKMYQMFPKEIPYPLLTIRKMTTRWGVCNVKTKRITLNLELIKKDIKYLDYVIVHELSHLIHPNHSKDFWNLVGILEPNYKKLRKELNNYE